MTFNEFDGFNDADEPSALPAKCHVKANMKNTNQRYLLLTSLLVLISVCSIYYITANTVAQQSSAMPAPQMVPVNNEYQVGAILFMQHAAENRALAYQAFNVAQMMLDQDLRKYGRKGKKRAIVVDADETVIDNSRSQAWLIKNRQNFTSKNWLDWVKREEATAVPGAVEFLTYAHKRDARIFYVTNRKDGEEKDHTVNNLNKLGFPDVSTDTVLCRSDATGSSKESRRQLILQKHRIVLLMGDNLNDLAKDFERKSVEDRNKAVDDVKTLFGSKFIVLPNPMYGEWENALYDYNLNRTEEEKNAIRLNWLKSY